MTPMTPAERRIHAARGRARRRAIAEGRPTTTKIDSAAARAHIQQLQHIGIGPKRLSELSEVPVATIHHILWGTGRAPSRRTEATIAAAILSVPADPFLAAPGAVIDSPGTRRRLWALIAAGWSTAELARRLGVAAPNLRPILLHRTRVECRTALAVRDLLEELWDVAPPQDTPRQKRAVREARARARAAGWPTAAGWDDEDIDLPEEELQAKLAALAADMDTDQLAAARQARYTGRDLSPRIKAAATEYARRKAADTQKDPDVTATPEPAATLPALAVPCPYCGAAAGDLCTSHSGTRVRRTSVHQDRTAAYRAREVADDDCVDRHGVVWPEHDFPPADHGGDCRRCDAEAADDPETTGGTTA
ncbi:hypothetical protein Q7689_00595 [Nocardiopsis tropica]|uniref:zinc finger domain-containing protein n=1 Tax=Nocardiopsis tropica TaxID=109330 RepID=UPI002E89CA9E|nr:hypothetical protein [Nocardiopsis tropica]